MVRYLARLSSGFYILHSRTDDEEPKQPVNLCLCQAPQTNKGSHQAKSLAGAVVRSIGRNIVETESNSALSQGIGLFVTGNKAAAATSKSSWWDSRLTAKLPIPSTPIVALRRLNLPKMSVTRCSGLVPDEYENHASRRTEQRLWRLP